MAKLDPGPMTHYLIRYKPTDAAETTTVGCLRFSGEFTHEQRRQSLLVWADRRRMSRPTLSPVAYLWLEEIVVEDAPVLTAGSSLATVRCPKPPPEPTK